MRLLRRLMAFVGLVFLLRHFYDEVIDGYAERQAPPQRKKRRGPRAKQARQAGSSRKGSSPSGKRRAAQGAGRSAGR